MFNKIEGMYHDHYTSGILKARRSEAHQVFSVDEVGFDPPGRFFKVICYAWDKANCTLGNG